MIHAFASYAMSQRLPHAKVILYSDAGHAFLFQRADRKTARRNPWHEPIRRQRWPDRTIARRL